MGKTLGENIADAKVLDADVIRPVQNAYSVKGGLAILFEIYAGRERREDGGGVGDAEIHRAAAFLSNT